jgi:ABC-2 type transport system ATP-binding protein
MTDSIYAIETSGLSKQYGNLKAVDGLDLAVRSGEIYGFLGPNGAGKTTTIKLMTGLLKPTSGTVKIMGKDIQKQHIEAKTEIGLIPDEPSIYEKLTGREFLYFVGSVFKVQREELVKRANELLKLFDLEEKQDELIQSYSHGMKQKITIVSALVHSPRVLFFDEPTVGLDPKSARIIKDILKIRAKAGNCIFISTHILEIAERMCDRIGIIQEGRLIAEGNMEKLRELSREGRKNLEEIFLELTGGDENMDLINSLSDRGCPARQIY